MNVEALAYNQAANTATLGKVSALRKGETWEDSHKKSLLLWTERARATLSIYETMS